MDESPLEKTTKKKRKIKDSQFPWKEGKPNPPKLSLENYPLSVSSSAESHGYVCKHLRNQHTVHWPLSQPASTPVTAGS